METALKSMLDGLSAKERKEVLVYLTVIPTSKKSNDITTILQIFNQVLGRRINVMAKGNRDIVKKRYVEIKSQKVSPSDIRGMIEMKMFEWKDTSMERYLDVKTLFAAKHFLSYIEKYRELKANPKMIMDFVEQSNPKMLDRIRQKKREDKFKGIA